ncbi:66s preribosome component loc1 [Diplodia corticola]|uniref:66s preribosome component loc1 n=1 Tax=Diplodia corticola TaxID=236234 RepID=A0A1J9QV70_9PEZI|nr:66s preribosome component loc1 [Diplodia corticola]OJD31874.1 66s preribosome component loc1 [Diplodia corticola]
MAPMKPQKSKPSAKGSSAKDAKPSKHAKPKTHTSIGTAKVDPKKKKKQRTYTEAELGIPTLNMITPAGVQKPKGKKKGKVFVDDQESMMTILAMVNAEKEGQIESKMMKARQMEEIREARKKEAEVRSDKKREKFEETKDSLRKKRKSKPDSFAEKKEETISTKPAKPSKKRVSFG